MSIHHTNSQQRAVIEQIKARAASDGDGVNLLRVFGGVRPERFDPFLLMDEFGSNEAKDYIGGFPPHPHRGFETISYMLEGKMEHRDHMGNVGLLNDGDVQWMTAGKGVIHSEMPQQTEGRMRGFQVWLNLPAKEKLIPARYHDVPENTIPQYDVDGAKVKAIAGSATINDIEVEGYFDVPNTEAVYLDIHVPAKAELDINLQDGINLLTYVYDGELQFGEKHVPAMAQNLTRFTHDGALKVNNTNDATARFLVLAGKPLKEPIVQHGPFVMNTIEEINQAIVDYQNNVLTA